MRMCEKDRKKGRQCSNERKGRKKKGRKEREKKKILNERSQRNTEMRIMNERMTITEGNET